MKKIIQTTFIFLIALLASGSSRCTENKNAAADKPPAVAGEQREGVAEMNDQTTGDRPLLRPDPGLPPSIDDRLTGANTQFGLQLLRALRAAGEGTKGNLFVSPLSVSVALTMTYNGASGKTADGMAHVLGFDGVDVATINQAMADLVTTLEQADSSVELTIANSLWGRQGFQFSSTFLERNREFYGAEITTLDFNAPDAPDTINRWVSDATHGKIDKIVDQIPPEIVLHLINAIYFKGRWEFEFDPLMTRDQTFNLAEGGSVKVPMMSRSGSYRYLEEDGLQAVRLPYGSRGMAMYVFLPGESTGLDGFLASLDENSWSQRLSTFRAKDGDVMLPRFKAEYKCLLNSPLREMGMGIAFDGGRADFSGMTSESADLFISKVVHKAVVEVNEEGTEAAAVTDITMGVTSVQPEQDRFRFVADRPFFFTICDDRTGTILFVGILNDPLS